MELLVLLVILGAIALVAILTYNGIIAKFQRRENAFSDIDVQLKQRYEVIPNLVETVKGYASHEKSLLENVTTARTRVGASGGGASADRLTAEKGLTSAMMNLFAVAENYPTLKADSNFRDLQAQLMEIENKIAAARRFFNSATSEYNTAVQQFPGVLFAGLFNFKQQPFFEVDEAEKARIDTPPSIKF